MCYTGDQKDYARSEQPVARTFAISPSTGSEVTSAAPRATSCASRSLHACTFPDLVTAYKQSLVLASCAIWPRLAVCSFCGAGPACVPQTHTPPVASRAAACAEPNDSCERPSPRSLKKSTTTASFRARGTAAPAASGGERVPQQKRRCDVACAGARQRGRRLASIRTNADQRLVPSKRACLGLQDMLGL
eukprot:5411801-Pleurochrysis_carterae.AAC.2